MNNLPKTKKGKLVHTFPAPYTNLLWIYFMSHYPRKKKHVPTIITHKCHFNFHLQNNSKIKIVIKAQKIFGVLPCFFFMNVSFT